MNLDTKNIIYSNSSLVDDFGRVFYYKDRIFRGVAAAYKEYTTALINSDFFKALQEKELIVKTWISEFNTPEFPLILEHELLHDSKPHQWSFQMLKDAAIHIIELNNLCGKYGFQLKDAHPYNVLFKNNKPIFIDLGSIVKKSDNSNTWMAYEQFINYNFVQLLYWSLGDFFAARKLIEDGNSPSVRVIPMNNILESNVFRPIENEIFNKVALSRFNDTYILQILEIFNRISFKLFKKNIKTIHYRRALKPYNEIINRIHFLEKPNVKSLWSDYHNVYSLNNKIEPPSPRFRKIIEITKGYQQYIDSSVDLAGNQGIFSELLRKEIPLKKVMLTDYDETAVDKAYIRFKCNNIPIIPHLYNFMIPLRDSEIEHLKADIAFALAITHHLILTQNYHLRTILERVNFHSKRYVAIEFMPLGLWNGNGEPDIPYWYTQDWFRKEFQKVFELILVESLEPNRILFFGKKKEKE